MAKQLELQQLKDGRYVLVRSSGDWEIISQERALKLMTKGIARKEVN